MISCPVFNQAIGVDPDASKFPSSKHVCLGASMLFLSFSFVPFVCSKSLASRKMLTEVCGGFLPEQSSESV